MASKLAQLRTMTTVVADTGDLDAVRHHRPIDCTTNPTIVLKAISGGGFEERLGEILRWGRRQTGSSEAVSAAVADRLAITVGAALAYEVPGRVSTEVDADLSFDVEKSVAAGRRIIAEYDRLGIDRKRVLIKLAATWEGIRAAEILQAEGIDCNLTLVFSLEQAIACADAGVFLISPFVGRIMDWHAARSGQTYQPDEDPGVISVRTIYNYYKSNGIGTIVMGASFRNTGEIEALSGCDQLTIAPALLEKLDAEFGELVRRLSPEQVTPAEPIELDEARFRWTLNENAMATEKLSEGIRLFAKDLRALRQLVRERLAV